MHVELIDAALGSAVPAELLPMASDHVRAARTTWVPEFQRRRERGQRDEDFLWDWKPKFDKVVACDDVFGYVVLAAQRVQGMLILQSPARSSRLEPAASLVYVNYLATAPWNRAGSPGSGRLRRTGLVLLGQAIRQSREAGFGGRVGLHALGGSETFYRQCRFHEFGPDPAFRGLPYFELDADQAARLLA